jgi:mono/diheme cytochrome c family protein
MPPEVRILHSSRLKTAAITAAAMVALWLPQRAQHAAAATPTTVSVKVANGRLLFRRYFCYSCHGTDGQGGAGARLKAPDLPPFAAFRRYVREPAGRMPAYRSRALSDAQLVDIYAYLKSIPAPPPAKDIPLLNQ